jgi:hypothetical protein
MPGCKHQHQLHPIPVIVMTETAKTKFPILRIMIKVVNLLPTLIKEKERACDANPEETSVLAPCPSSPKPVGPVPPPVPVRPQVQLRHSQCEKKVPVKPGNVYGDKHPVAIEKDMLSEPLNGHR